MEEVMTCGKDNEYINNNEDIQRQDSHCHFVFSDNYIRKKVSQRDIISFLSKEKNKIQSH